MIVLKIIAGLCFICMIVLVACAIWELALKPVLFNGIFGADLEGIDTKREYEECVKMDFDKWYDIFCLNTEKWTLSCLPCCKVNIGNRKHGDIIVTDCYGLDCFNSKTIFVDFGLVGNLKYSRWRCNYLKNKKVQEAQEKEMRNLKLILEGAQKDIEILKKQAEEEINQAVKITNNIQKNMM